jgi:hypothetical protein
MYFNTQNSLLYFVFSVFCYRAYNPDKFIPTYEKARQTQDKGLPRDK